MHLYIQSQGRHKVGWRPWVEPFLGAPRFQKNGVLLLLTSRILRYLGNLQFLIVKHTLSNLLKRSEIKVFLLVVQLQLLIKKTYLLIAIKKKVVLA